jgi:hypothetical protein
MPLIIRRFLYPLLYVAAIIVFAFLFAPLGFNPTDDGVVLAQVERFWSGQIPFVDFISIRPFGSVFIHWPALLFGDYSLLASRYLTVFEIAFYSYAFLYFTIRRMRVEVSDLSFWCLAGISFVLNVHSFPLMAWTTIDALFLVGIGVYIRTRVEANSYWLILAYALIAFAALCRQTFLPVAIIAIWYFQDWKNWKAYLGSSIPFVVLIYYLSLHGILREGINQMTVSSIAIKDILRTLIEYKGAYAGLVIGACFVLLWQFQKHRHWKWLNSIVLLLPFVAAIVLMVLLWKSNSYRFMPIAIWVMLLPIMGSEMRFHHLSRHYALLLFALLVSGFTAISIGYPSPALIASWPWIIVLLWTIKRFTPMHSIRWVALACLGFVWILSVIIRLNNIYRQPHSEFLQYKTKYSGLQGIWMDKNTAESLNELATWEQHLNGPSILLFDYAACRHGVSKGVELAGDWITQAEFPNKQLQDDLLNKLFIQDNRYWIVQKYCSDVLADSLVAQTTRNDTLQIKIMQMLKKQSIVYNEGKYFAIYRQ